MFKLKYNILALLQILISAANYFLLMKFFGVSANTDAYMIATAIFSALTLLQMLTIEQFMFFYNDIKKHSSIESNIFYNSALTVSLITGVVSFLLFYFGSALVLNFFVHENNIELLETFFKISVLELLVAPIWLLNQKLLNAEMRFTAPYILNFIPSTFVLLTMIYINYFAINDLSLLLYAKVIGSFLIIPLSFYMIIKLGINIKFQLKHKKVKEFILNSFTMRFGHNIHNFFFTPVITNIVTLLPSGYASYFYYAMKISSIVNSLIVGPSLKIFQSKFSREWSNEKFYEAKSIVFQYVKITLPLVVVSSIVVYYILPTLLSYISPKFTLTDIRTIQNVFLGLMVWYTIILVESGSVAVLVAAKQSKYFIFTNSLFIVMFYLLAQVMLDEFALDALVYALVISQIINFMIYFHYAKKIFKIQRRMNGA